MFNHPKPSPSPGGYSKNLLETLHNIGNPYGVF